MSTAGLVDMDSFFSDRSLDDNDEKPSIGPVSIQGPPRCGKTALLFQYAYAHALQSPSSHVLFISPGQDRLSGLFQTQIEALGSFRHQDEGSRSRYQSQNQNRNRSRSRIDPAVMKRIHHRYIDSAFTLSCFLSSLTLLGSEPRLAEYPACIVIDDLVEVFAPDELEADCVVRVFGLLNDTIQAIRQKSRNRCQAVVGFSIPGNSQVAAIFHKACRRYTRWEGAIEPDPARPNVFRLVFSQSPLFASLGSDDLDETPDLDVALETPAPRGLSGLEQTYQVTKPSRP